MKVTLECFGRYRELCSGPEITLELDGAHATVDGVKAALAEAFPMTADWLPRTAVARADQLVQGDAAVNDGERLALIPPVSGGGH